MSRESARIFPFFHPQKPTSRLRHEVGAPNLPPRSNSDSWSTFFMRVQSAISLLVLFLFGAGAANAQTAGVVTLNANSTSATGSLTPVLTWSTNPVAQSCTASGGWSGTKAASGTQTLATITASANYTLTCTWGSGSANVTWTAPTTNVDGSALTNLAKFKIYYGTSTTALNSSVTVDDITRRSATVSSLSPGTWYFAVRAVNTAGTESSNSNVASKAVTGAQAAKTVSITINAAPPPPTSNLVTISVNVWDVRKRSDGVWARIGVVGKIALGKPCSSSFKVGAHHYLVNRSDVTLTKTPASTQLVVY